MATRGRKPTPTHLKLVTGNPGKRRLPKNEPRPPPALPSVPPHLDDVAKVEWGRIVEKLYDCQLMTDIDRAALAVYCQAWSQWLHASEDLRRMAEKDPVTHAAIIRTQSGNMIQNPLIGVVNRAAEIMLKAAAEFGMTPSARSRIDTGNLIPPSGNTKPGNGTDGGSEFF